MNVDDPPKTIKSLGHGAYGVVDLVEINGVQCASKKMFGALVGGPDEEYVSSSQRIPIQEKFQQECLTICKMRHPNIVQFMGAYEKNSNAILYMEYLPIDLGKCLEIAQSNKFNIPIPVKLSILTDVCCGLLHIHNSSFLHRDLTAKNVLLTHNLKAKISDFGCSKHDNRSQQLTKVPGAYIYMPPEAKCETPSYSTPLDVFSFGVLTLFVAIQEFPSLPMTYIDIPPNLRKRGEVEIYTRRQWISKLREQHPLHPLVLSCLQDNLSRRPAVDEIHKRLQDLYDRLSDEIKDREHEKMLLFMSSILHH